ARAARDDGRPHAEAWLPLVRGGLGAHRSEALAEHGRRLAPRQVHVGGPGGDALRRRRGAAEVDRRRVLERTDQPAVFDPVVLAGKIEALAPPYTTLDLEELVGARDARVEIEEDAVTTLPG